MNIVIGNLITVVENDDYDVVLHGCNCFNTMGAGVALAVADAWPEAVAADKLTASGDIGKLGTYSMARVTRRNRRFAVYNLYCQYRYGSKTEHNFDYMALHKALHQLAIELGNETLRIAFPLIGCGNGGGRWRKVKPLIEKYLGHHDLTLVKI